MSEYSVPSATDAALYRDKNLHIIFSITLMAVLGVSSITPAFPRIAQELKVSIHSIGLLITVFTLPGIFLTPLLGVLADRFGRKRILLPSLFLFAIAGGLCGLMRDFRWLLVMRFFQGMGVASLGSLNLTLIGDLFPGKQRTIAMGYNSSVLSVGTATYPALGGAVAVLGWYYPFFLPLLAIPVGLIAMFGLKNPEPKNRQNILHYLRDALKSMHKKRVYIFFVANLVTFIILYGVYLSYIPILLNSRFHSSTVIIGLIMSSMSVVTAVTSSQLRRLIERFSEVQLLRTSYLIYTIGLALIPFITHLPVILLPVLIFGIAHGMNIPVVQSLLAGEAPMEHRAAFMSISGMVLRLGQTLGPLIMGGIYVLWGLDSIFFCSSLLTLIFLVLLLVFLRISRD